MKFFVIFMGKFAGIYNTGWAQSNFENYQTIRAQGDIPEDFLLSYTEKFQHSIHRDSLAKLNPKAMKTREAFYEQNIFYVNQLIQSGKILFGDTITRYINRVADRLLENNLPLRKQVRFYAVRSASVNAFSTSSGMILVNVGLLAKLENEAQLAFVLSHEISHFTQQHDLNIFLESQRVAQSKGIFSSPNVDDVLLVKNNYSKEKEQEADLLGLDRYLTAGYDTVSALCTFEILKQAHLPFANIPFQYSFLEKGALKFPTEALLHSLSAADANIVNEQTSGTTHPSPDLRRMAVSRRMAEQRLAKGEAYRISRADFEFVRECCRFENSNLYVLNRRYEQAIYHNFLLSQAHPNNLYLQKNTAYALYGLASYTANGKFWDIHTDYENIDGYSKQVAFLLEKISGDELLALALVYVDVVWQQYPQDVELTTIRKEIAQILNTQYNTSTNLLPSHLAEFARAQKPIEVAAQPVGRGVKHAKKFQQIAYRRGFALGLPKVVFVSPDYQRVDQYGINNTPAHRASERSRLLVEHLLDSFATKQHLPHSILSHTGIQRSDISRFNDLALLNEWMSEKYDHDDLQLHSIYQDEVRQLAQKYGTPYFVWTFWVAATLPKPGGRYWMCCLPILPIGIYYAVTPQHNTFCYTLVYDVRTGEYLIEYPRFMRLRDAPDVLNALTYDIILQLKRKN